MQHTISRPALAASRPARFAVLAAVMRLFTAWQHRREVERLLGADDRMLADIGLSRSDVEGALSRPAVEDPSFYLVRARQERRRAGFRRF